MNNAGCLKAAAMGSDACNLDNFMFHLNGNTKCTFEMMEHSIPELKKAGKDALPSIINVSSINGLVSFGGVPSYCVAKAAVDMLTKCAAVDLAPYGIRVNSVNPGVVITDFQKKGGMNDENYAAFVKRSMDITHPLAAGYQELPMPEDVAELILFLASPKSKFISGDTVKIDCARGVLGAR